MLRCRSGAPSAELAARLARSATSEILALVPSADERPQAWRTDCASALGRGVPVRLVHEPAGQGAPSVGADVRALVDMGAEARIADRVPLALLVVDRSMALLSAGSRTGADLLVREPVLVESMATLFGETWGRAELYRGVGSRPAARDRTVLNLMSRGVADGCAARSMGISMRTYRRWVADLMDRLGASSRFQAGVLAAGGGWLDELTPGPAPKHGYRPAHATATADRRHN